MQRHASGPDVVAYSAAICECEKGQQPQHALLFLRAMQRHAVVLNVTTYGAAISAWERPVALAGLEFPAAMRHCAIVLGVITYSVAICVCDKGQQCPQALHLL